MKSIQLLAMLASLLITANCKDEEPESRKRGQDQFLFSIAMAGFFKPNFCSAPELLLEEGKVYNITLEPGKQFWYAYSVSSMFQENSKKLRLTITRSSNDNIKSINVPCDNSVENGDIRNPVTNAPTLLEFEIGDIYRFESTGFKVGQVIKSDKLSSITLKFDLF